MHQEIWMCYPEELMKGWTELFTDILLPMLYVEIRIKTIVTNEDDLKFLPSFLLSK